MFASVVPIGWKCGGGAAFNITELGDIHTRMKSEKNQSVVTSYFHSKKKKGSSPEVVTRGSKMCLTHTHHTTYIITIIFLESPSIIIILSPNKFQFLNVSSGLSDNVNLLALTTYLINTT